MKILSIDTTGSTCSVAVVIDGQIYCELSKNAGLTHSQTLMPMVETVLEGMDVSDMDAIAVAVGPGSFTGVRIGVCVAKALAQAIGKKVACINTLDSLAQNVSGFNGVICAMLDARRGEVYAAAYKDGKKILPDMADKVETVISLLSTNKNVIFVGDGAVSLRQKIIELRSDAFFAGENNVLQRASSGGVLAEKMQNELVAPEDVSAHYLRESQAQRVRREKLLKTEK